MSAPPAIAQLHPAPARRLNATPGFALSGFIMAITGALLPAWGYDVSGDYATAGSYFLALVSGMALAGAALSRLRSSIRTRTFLVVACALMAAGLSLLAMTPDEPFWRWIGLGFLGVASALLNRGLFNIARPGWERNAAQSVIAAGASFCAGSVVPVLVVASTFWALPISRTLLALCAIPLAFMLFFAGIETQPRGLVSHPAVLRQFRSGAAILFSLLLFFQFGNEWTIAGWLPIYLIHRLAISPAAALGYLAGYFLALLLGRIAGYFLLPHVHHGRLLTVSAAASLFGCVLLARSANRLGAITGMILAGLGFAAIYPIVSAWIGRRFSYYHPGYFNGIFSVALVGGMLAPWMMGELAERTSLGFGMALPALGTCMVLLLVVLIWVEARVTGE